MKKENLTFFKRLIEDKKNYRENRLRDWDKIHPDKVPIAYYGLATDARSIAIYSLILGDRVESLEWFNSSTEYYIKSIESERSLIGDESWGMEAKNCLEALDLAILSDNRELIDQCVYLSHSISDKNPIRFEYNSQYYYFVIAFANYLAGNINNSIHNLNLIDVSKCKDREAYFEGLKACLSGLIDNNKDRFISSLKILLSYHNRHFVGSRIDYGIVSIDATVLLKIAREKGIVVEPEDIKCFKKYVLWNLYNPDKRIFVSNVYVDLKEGLECNLLFIDDIFKHWEELKPENAYGSLGGYARATAIFSLSLGYKDEALKWFKRSFEFYNNQVSKFRSISGFGWEGDARSCNDALNAAILSGDKELIGKSIQLFSGIYKGFPFKYGNREDWTRAANYFYLNTLIDFLTGNRDTAIQKLNFIHPEKQKGKVDYFRGLQTILQGLIDGSKDELINGLFMFLAYHDNEYDGSMSAEGIICIDATVLINIARIKGIIIKSEDIDKNFRKYIPWNLFE